MNSLACVVITVGSDSHSGSYEPQGLIFKMISLSFEILSSLEVSSKQIREFYTFCEALLNNFSSFKKSSMVQNFVPIAGPSLF